MCPSVRRYLHCEGHGAMTTSATVKVSRESRGSNPSPNGRAWTVVIDGSVVGSIADAHTVELPVEPGRHSLRVASMRYLLSRERSFEATDGQVVEFSCHARARHPFSSLLAESAGPTCWVRPVEGGPVWVRALPSWASARRRRVPGAAASPYGRSGCGTHPPPTGRGHRGRWDLSAAVSAYGHSRITSRECRC